jgi:ppGpp synthetase/RelA/SpoT-type nucleotidyltranferase
MAFDLTVESFLAKSGYTEDDWKNSSLDWGQLVRIAEHHDASLQTLALYGGAIANRIQAFSNVHSVRWRVKDTFSLIKKILRKNLEVHRKTKWETISSENYRSVVSDLIGVRALHLLKEECIEVDKQIRDTWNLQDTTIFKRDGDTKLTEIIERGATEELHSAGYRSIHYGITYQPEKEPILVEVQVRTIFQEAWSEIDHKIRYPDFSENELLKYFLSVFNGLSGTADDMGSFVMMLDDLIKTQAASILAGEVALATRDSDVEKLQLEIDKLRADGKTPDSSIDSLQTTVDKIKNKDAINHIQPRLNPYLANNFDYAKARALLSFAPNVEFVNAIKNLRIENSAIADALKSINRPNAAFVDAIKRVNLPSDEIKSAMKNMARPSTDADGLQSEPAIDHGNERLISPSIETKHAETNSAGSTDSLNKK